MCNDHPRFAVGLGFRMATATWTTPRRIAVEAVRDGGWVRTLTREIVETIAQVPSSRRKPHDWWSSAITASTAEPAMLSAR
jgi:hypothetical protein